VNDKYIRTGDIDAARKLITTYHYSRRMPGCIILTATVHLGGGLFGDCGEPIAAITFSNPTAKWSEQILELSRLVRINDTDYLLTQLISFACKEIHRRREYDLLISFADKTHGHHGGIYQAASWFYAGMRKGAMDGLIINDKFLPGRTCNARFNTRSPERLKKLHSQWNIKPHYDEGKYLYWKPLNRSGIRKAKRLGLTLNKYPKPDAAEVSKVIHPGSAGKGKVQFLDAANV